MLNHNLKTLSFVALTPISHRKSELLFDTLRARVLDWCSRRHHYF
jgi:hypothetical protein